MNNKYHAPIPTVNDFDEAVLLDEEEKAEDLANRLKPMDICSCNTIPSQSVAIGVVLMGPFNIPYFHDGGGSDYAYKPLDIQNPEEWGATFSAYIVFDLVEQIHKICPAGSIKKIEPSKYEGHMPFDYGTSQLRCNLGLIDLANKWWSKE